MSSIVAKPQSMSEVVESLKSFDGRGLFLFVARTTKDALKKSRKTKEPTPERLSVVTTIRIQTVSLGNEYEKAVNNRLLKEGKEVSFEAQGSYCSPVGNSKLLYKHSSRDQYYLRVYPNLCESFKTVVRRFDKNGQEISAERWKDIEAEYFPLKGESDNQGLDNPIMVNNYKLENVLYLKRGDFMIDSIDADFFAKMKG